MFQLRKRYSIIPAPVLFFLLSVCLAGLWLGNFHILPREVDRQVVGVKAFWLWDTEYEVLERDRPPPYSVYPVLSLSHISQIRSVYVFYEFIRSLLIFFLSFHNL